MATETSVAPVVIRAGANPAELAYHLDNAKIDLVAGLAARRPLPPVVVLDLRRYAGSERAVGQALTFRQFCEAAGTKLALLVAPSRVKDTIAEFRLERILGVCGVEELRDQFGIDADARSADPPDPPPPTEEEIRQMLADGYTLSDAIREIEPLLRAE